jgi:hypothetical protein
LPATPRQGRARCTAGGRLFRIHAAAVAGHALDLVHLEIHRPRAVGQHVVFVLLAGEVDAVGAALEQVDGRRAVEREMGGVERLFEAGVAAVQQDDDFELALRAGAQRRAAVRHFDEHEALGEGEVFLQQAVALEAALAAGQQRVFLGKAARLQRRLRQQLVPGGVG